MRQRERVHTLVQWQFSAYYSETCNFCDVPDWYRIWTSCQVHRSKENQDEHVWLKNKVNSRSINACIVYAYKNPFCTCNWTFNSRSNCVMANHLHHANKTKQLTILSHFSWCIDPSFDLPFLIWLLIHITAAIESEQTFAKFAFEWNKQFILWALFQFLTCMNDEKVEFLIGFSSIDGHLSSIIAI